MVNKFDAELSRHLRPVTAPEELWDRIQQVGPARPAARVGWPVWACAAALAATIALCCLSLRSETTFYLASVATGQMSAGSEQVDFRSDDPARIRAWVKANTGLDIALPADGVVHLVGASLIRNHGLAACVSYRVGNQTAKLVVARGTSGAPQHPAVQQASYQGTAVASWAMNGQTYVLAATPAQEVNAACVLCHVDGSGQKPARRAQKS